MKWMWMAAALLVVPAVRAAPAPGAPPADEGYRAVLADFVDANGRVDYAGLRKRRANLDDVIARLARVDPGAYEAWSREDRIAFWINAYNAITLRVVIDHYPVGSIRDIPGVWDRMQFVVMGHKLTLDDIENRRLRPGFSEPRLHMALVCAAVSCPKLRDEPYQGARLDAQLDDQVRAFLADPRHFRIDRERGSVRVSEIFRWYAEDFAPSGTAKKDAKALERAALVGFVSAYLGAEERAFLAAAAVEYAPYDWALNESPR